jgi:hypothetical protein
MDIEKEPIPTPEITEIGGNPIRPEIINGVKINFVAVEHNANFLKKYYDKFENLIYNSSLVISESVPFEFTSRLDKEILIDQDFANFFGGITDIAKISPKRITVVDPNTPGTSAFDALLEGSTLVASAIKIVKILAGKENITRRTFIKGLGLAGLTLATNVQGPQGLFGNEIIPKDIGSHGIDDTIAFSNFNYRNAFSAYAIDHITKQYSNLKSPIVHISGNAHPKNIIDYLKENKTEGEIKKRLYNLTPYNLLGRQSIRNYEVVNNQWQLKSEIRP